MSIEELTGKIIIVGNSTVGKTTLSMCQLKLDVKSVKSTTCAAAFFEYLCTIDNHKINLEIWDTAGQEQFQDKARNYYRNVDCALIVFDVTNAESFNCINNWYEAINLETENKASVILVANKVDNESNRVITTDVSIIKARKMHCPLVETSALLGIHVENLFKLAAKIVMGSKYDISFNGVITKTRCRHSTITKCKFCRPEVYILYRDQKGKKCTSKLFICCL